jgi:HlyD family secretion protein
MSCINDQPEDKISASGTIEATEITVSSKMGGQIEHLSFDEGKKITKGDTLAIIDHSMLDLQLKQANAAIESAEANLELLLQGARIEDIEQAEEGLKQAKANFELATEEWNRINALYESGAATGQQRDSVLAQYKVAEAQYNAAKQNLQKLKQLIRPEEVKMSRSKLAQAKTNAELIQKQIEDCFVIAPMNGTITNKPVEIGELVGQGSAIAKLSNLDKLDLMIYVTEVELGKVKLGQTAEISIDTYPDKTFEGTVIYISPEAEFTPKNIQTKEDRVKLVFGVKLEIINRDGILKAGMPADAVLK